MKQAEDLFQLIHSLEKHEKRFFKLFASIEEGDHSYMKIFDLIDKQKVYDEAAIQKQFGIQKNVFAVQKHYLFHLILNRITLLHSSKESQLRMFLTQADILYKKGLYSSYEKLLRKSKSRAVHLEMYGVLLEILRMEHINAWRKADLKEAELVIEEEKKILALFNNQKQYTHLANEIITLLSDNKDEKNKKRLNQLMRHPFIVNEKNALTFNSKYTLFHTLYTYYIIYGNFRRQYYFGKKANDLYETHPEKIKHNPLQYLYSLHNLISSCNDSKKYEEAKIYIDKLQSNSALLTSEREKSWAFFTYHDNNSVFYIKTGNFEEGILSAEKLIRELNESKIKMDKKHYVLLYFDAAKIFFGTGDYKQCLASMNKIQHERETIKTQSDLDASVRIFYLLLHYEKGNIELLEHIIKSELRNLSGTDTRYKIENVLFEFFGKSIQKINSQKEFKELFAGLKKQLLLLRADKNEKIIMEQFDYISWVESKIENKPFAEVVKAKAKING